MLQARVEQLLHEGIFKDPKLVHIGKYALYTLLGLLPTSYSF